MLIRLILKLIFLFGMEGSKIAIFENFAVTTVVMPYYGCTHQAFLLLSKLSKGARSKLYEFYDEFVFAMKKYWTILKIDKMSFGKLFTPCDLFIYEFGYAFIFDQNIHIFIEFITNLNKLKGYYFCDLYMHRGFMIFDNLILVNSSSIKELYPVVDILKSIRIYHWDIDGIQQFPSTTLLNIRVLYIIRNNIKN